MKNLFFILVIWSISLAAQSQELPVSTQQQLENLSDIIETETEDDSYLQDIEQFRQNPVNLNYANEEELKQLRILSAIQIAALISYRSILGLVENLYELQAIPSWDIGTIKKLLPYITVTMSLSPAMEAGNRMRGGTHSIVLRVSQIMEAAEGFKSAGGNRKYAGSPQRVFLRYRYTFKNNLQWGMTGDKDAGEPFLRGKQRWGFDFYSFHFFARKLGAIRALALGDFVVNLGQGLVHWQGLAFGKSAEITGIKRQSPVLMPYSSAGEFNFLRGAGITIQKKRWESSFFVSMKSSSANLEEDSSSGKIYITSLLSSGYHRTDSEISNRKNVSGLTVGTNLTWKEKKWGVGMNGVFYRFSLPLEKRPEPYNYYTVKGDTWYNSSVDYSFTHKNFHLFGELALDKKFNKALLSGILISLDAGTDMSLLYRNINPAYQSLYGNAFTENSLPSNENGLFTGISLRPVAGIKFDAYADIYLFPWLKYLVDAPSSGSSYMAQFTYTPNKQVEIILGYRRVSKGYRVSNDESTVKYLAPGYKSNWRGQFNFSYSRQLSFRGRVDYCRVKKPGQAAKLGNMVLFDILYKRMQKPYNLVARLQYFETDDYDARVYVFENNVQYSYSIPALFGWGYRYYLNLDLKQGEKWTFWVRWAQTIYKGQQSSGSGNDEIIGNKRSELTLQTRLVL